LKAFDLDKAPMLGEWLRGAIVDAVGTVKRLIVVGGAGGYSR
jgi:hypothetical protein